MLSPPIDAEIYLFFFIKNRRIDQKAAIRISKFVQLRDAS